MKAILAWTSLFLVAASSGSALAVPNQYLCTVEHAAGLHYDKQTGAWRPQEFGSRKYVLRRLTADDRDEKKGKWWPLLKDAKANWAFFNYGEADPMPVASCVENEDALVLPEMFSCQPIVGSAKFDSDTRRFEMIYRGGYIDQGFWEQRRRENPTAKLLGNPSKPDDLFIEIGNCSPS
jgi:hypothetical protein